MKSARVFTSRQFDVMSAEVKDLPNGNHIYLSRKGDVVEIRPSGAVVQTHEESVWDENPMEPVQTWFDQLPSGRTIKKLEKVRVSRSWYPVESVKQVYVTDGVSLYLLELTEFHNHARPHMWENRWVRTPLVMPEDENPIQVISELTDQPVFSLSDFMQVFGPDVKFHEEKPTPLEELVELPF